jgi:hypothetical protein
MALTAILFIPVAMRYRERTHIQQEAHPDADAGS